jgi:hypothetical protein
VAGPRAHTSQPLAPLAVGLTQLDGHPPSGAWRHRLGGRVTTAVEQRRSVAEDSRPKVRVPNWLAAAVRALSASSRVTRSWRSASTGPSPALGVAVASPAVAGDVAPRPTAARVTLAPIALIGHSRSARRPQRLAGSWSGLRRCRPACARDQAGQRQRGDGQSLTARRVPALVAGGTGASRREAFEGVPGTCWQHPLPAGSVGAVTTTTIVVDLANEHRLRSESGPLHEARSPAAPRMRKVSSSPSAGASMPGVKRIWLTDSSSSSPAGSPSAQCRAENCRGAETRRTRWG